MKYLKLFDDHLGYEDFVSGGTMARPNVSHCVAENEVHYNPHTFADEYLTFVAKENGTFTFTPQNSNVISYSTDDGETWTTTNNTDNKSEHLAITVNVSEGDKVMWKGDAEQLGFYNGDEVVDDVVGSFFSSDCEFDAQGNIMSLLYGDDFKGKTTIENEYAFTHLFHDFGREKICNVVNAKNLSLPASTLANYCYEYMFYGCRNLTTAPELPAKTLAEGCYNDMFLGCTSLTVAPELPATTLANYCYNGMFFGCTNLTTAPELPATTLTEWCYRSMFYDCTSLTTAPSVLPATTLAEGCYEGMFEGCTSLTTTPELPATTVVIDCYYYMFKGCTSLTTAPELPATTLVDNCYNGIFSGCTSLNYIKAMFTTTPSTTYTRSWVSGVASSGTFVKNCAAAWNVTGDNGIPNGWTVETATA